jgi:hypothetical protein
LKVASLVKAGRNARVLDSEGLHLQVRGPGRASWILRYVSPVTGKTREMGLGAVAQVSLAEARDAARDARAQVRKKIDPVEAKRPARATAGPESPTFGATAEAFFEANQSRYRNAKVRHEWLPMLGYHPRTGQVGEGRWRPGAVHGAGRFARRYARREALAAGSPWDRPRRHCLFEPERRSVAGRIARALT